MSISDNYSKVLDTVNLSKTAKWLLLHLSNYGGEVNYDSDTGYNYYWATLLKSEDIKWHGRSVSLNTFVAIRQFLEMLDSDDLLGQTIYGINSAGQAAAEALKAIEAGVGGGEPPATPDAGEPDYDAHEGEGDPEDGWQKCVSCQAFTIDPATDRCIHWDKDPEHHEAWYGDAADFEAAYAMNIAKHGGGPEPSAPDASDGAASGTGDDEPRKYPVAGDTNPHYEVKGTSSKGILGHATMGQSSILHYVQDLIAEGATQITIDYHAPLTAEQMADLLKQAKAEADAAARDAARAATVDLTKSQWSLLKRLAEGKVIGRSKENISYSWHDKETGLTSYQSKTTEPLIQAKLVNEVPGPENDYWYYRVLELTATGRAALEGGSRD